MHPICHVSSCVSDGVSSVHSCHECGRWLGPRAHHYPLPTNQPPNQRHVKVLLALLSFVCPCLLAPTTTLGQTAVVSVWRSSES